jgi:RimJ/RimL family protein N-acetyltransferase
MTALHTTRLVLHAVDMAEGERIRDRRPADDDRWAADFPLEGDIIGVAAYLRATADHGEQRPFGFYRITRIADGQAIGGIGFKGQPKDRSVAVGYGIVPSARGHRYAAEALTALLDVAAGHDLDRVVADTDRNNTPSQRTLERAGFARHHSDAALHFYEVFLGQRLIHGAVV